MRNCAANTGTSTMPTQKAGSDSRKMNAPGRMIYEAVLSRDYPVLQGGFLLITIVVVFANLLSEAVYPLLDPRVRQARPGAAATGAA